MRLWPAWHSKTCQWLLLMRTHVALAVSSSAVGADAAQTVPHHLQQSIEMQLRPPWSECLSSRAPIGQTQYQPTRFTCVRHICGPGDALDLLQGLQLWRQPSMHTQDLQCTSQVQYAWGDQLSELPCGHLLFA